MIKKIQDYTNDVVREMKRVSWLTKDELLSSTGIVAIFAVFMAIFLFFVDFGLSRFMSLLFGA